MNEQRHRQRNPLVVAVAMTVGPMVMSVQAQVAPDAGQTLQQLKPSIEGPRENRPLPIQTLVASDLLSPGGAVVLVQALSFAGNSVISHETLDATLVDVPGKSFDIAGLRALSKRISDFYHASGYPFARAVLPPQDLQKGVLRIEIIEGRYGLVQAQAEKRENDALATQATPFLNRLKTGAVIESASLERALLILDDQPGIKSAPLVRPGTQAGTGDLIVQVSRDKRITGDVGLDNAGSRYTGPTRARAYLNINSLFLLGDQIKITVLASDEQLWMGAVGYSLPLGPSSLRGNVGYATTSYVLAKEFASLHAHGTANVASAGLSYPLVRSQKTNLTLSGTYQAKDLRDNQDSFGISTHSRSDSVPIALQFDGRDSVGGDGLTYGILSWTPGKLKLDSSLTSADINNTRGSFDKFNLDVVRVQSLPTGFSLMGRLSLQSASKNLDSSEKMSLGGTGGVRAYPTGEASGDQGALAQLEFRYRAGPYVPFVFWDGGRIKTDAEPINPAANNERSVTGAGVGVRYQHNAWRADATLAWRITGGKPQADTSNDRKPRMWVNMGYQF